jgi:AraC-like DNA-binding protein
MDLGDITHRIFENQSIEENSDTKKILLMRFMGKLETSINKNRSVGYYASELCVSSQYLERVVKALSKHSAKEWIQQVMISQVNKKLLETNYPIQQLANEFGFIDQQTFTKYYRRIMKVTPTEYRKKAMI